MRIFEIIESSSVNGPGCRFCVWLSGCYRCCRSCFNTNAALFSSGYEISVDDLFEKIKQSGIKSVSFSGGEPFYQDEELSILLGKLKKIGIDILIFTGYTYSDLIKHNFKSIKYCDYLIDGEFIENFDSSCCYTGSGNQRFLKLKNGKIIEDLTLKITDNFNKTLEITINSDGAICTGYLDI